MIAFFFKSGRVYINKQQQQVATVSNFNKNPFNTREGEALIGPDLESKVSVLNSLLIYL